MEQQRSEFDQLLQSCDLYDTPFDQTQFESDVTAMREQLATCDKVLCESKCSVIITLKGFVYIQKYVHKVTLGMSILCMQCVGNCQARQIIVDIKAKKICMYNVRVCTCMSHVYNIVYMYMYMCRFCVVCATYNDHTRYIDAVVLHVVATFHS